ncbi:MAG: hypothetical protein IIT63_14000 [Prevotella sp.]|nr:hypothetical protein [Prevotella sp.]
MTVDNFDQIEKLLDFKNDGDFYMIQIMQRGKDQNDGRTSSSVRIIKSYFADSIEYLEERREEIKGLCEFFNARACINLNKKNKKQVSMKGLELMAHLVAHEEYHTFRSIFETACGQTGACDGNKTWIVDVDTKDETELSYIIEAVNQCEPFDREKIVAEIPTPHGIHLITRPFNKKTFSGIYKNSIDIHDGTPTVLYYKDKEE